MRAVHLLRHEYAIITLCRVLNVNHSSYYKIFNSKEPKIAIENRNIKTVFYRFIPKQNAVTERRKCTGCLKLIMAYALAREECTD